MSTSEAPGEHGTDAAGAGYTLHVVAHSHWDREWYLPFQEHRRRLVAFFDELLDLLERDPQFASFHLDGQTIMLDDYLEIRPQRRADLERQARAGRIVVGPWYVQPDEFLVSGEALVRNLLLGLRRSAPYGGGARLGYLPDSFGHISQMPQILRLFGIDAAVFGRGLPVLRDGPNGPQPAPFGSEIVWRAADGSAVLGIVLTGWYNNAMELPTEPSAALARLRAIRDDAAPHAATRHLLLMNGMDHQPVQSDLTEALAAAGATLAPDTVVQDSLPGYLRALRATLGDAGTLQTATGELRGQATDGRGTLANTASARLYLKRQNHDAQVALERHAEPLAACAALLGAPYPGDLLRYAWARLLQNHAHDSICGCSIDPVHEDMVPRFRDSLAVAHLVAREAAARLCAAAGAAGPSAGDMAPVVIFNTLPWARGGLVELEVDLARRPCGIYPGPAPAPQDLSPRDPAAVRLRDPGGAMVPCTIEDLGVVWDFALPEHRTRDPFYARRIRVRAALPSVPGLGYTTLQLTVAEGIEPAPAATDLQAGPTWLENAHLRVDVAPDGSLAILDKAGGERYAGLNVYEGVGDIGDEYIFRPVPDEQPATTAGGEARCRIHEASPARAALRIGQFLEVPAHAEPVAAGRGAGRSAGRVALELETTVSLTPGGRAVEIALCFDNRARDHRLRALFPAGMRARMVQADSAFDVVDRATSPWPGWRNPADPQPQQEFVSISEGWRGLLIANRGLPEYEVLDDGGTIALTLLRAVGHLGDWGIFPTPGAQCQGPWRAEYAVVPHAGDWTAAMRTARDFATPLYGHQAWSAGATGACARLGATASLLAIEGDGVVLSAFKGAEDGDELIVRLYNPTGRLRTATLRSAVPLSGACLTTLDERRLSPLAVEDGRAIAVDVGPKAIVTLALRRGDGR